MKKIFLIPITALIAFTFGCSKSNTSEIIKSEKIIFDTLNAKTNSLNGIGGYNLDFTVDKIVAFDYEHSGKKDYLLLYRPGKSVVWILKNTNGSFSPVFQSTNGIGG